MGFLFAILAGSVATAHFVPDRESIGASGGVLGVLGMLLGFELLHQKLVPKSARRRLAAGVVGTFLIGLFGYSFIDNAAHAGGLVAGVAYALLVFPRSHSARRPKVTRADCIGGVVAGGVLTACALWAFWRMVVS
jgi:membrane associated rhomboid family serine protease